MKGEGFEHNMDASKLLVCFSNMAERNALFDISYVEGTQIACVVSYGR